MYITFNMFYTKILLHTYILTFFFFSKSKINISQKVIKVSSTPSYSHTRRKT